MMNKDIIRLGCGVDISKDKFDACMGYLNSDNQFKVLKTKKFKNTKTGIVSFIVWVKELCKKLDSDSAIPFQLVMETTGVYHEPLCLASYNSGFSVCLEVASRVKQYLKYIGHESKNDKLDAKGICQLACERKLRLWKPCSKHIIGIRTALRHRKMLLKNLVRLKSQLHAKQFSSYSLKEVESSIKQLIKTNKKELVKIEKHIDSLYESDEVLKERVGKIVGSLKGVGLYTVLIIVAETNGFSEIQSGRQLASYAGYDIIENQSGKRQGSTRISKKGNTRIREQLYMSAMSVINTKKGHLYEFFKRIMVKNPKAYKVGNVAVQRKILLLIYTLYRKNQEFNPKYDWKQNHLKEVALV